MILKVRPRHDPADCTRMLSRSAHGTARKYTKPQGIGRQEKWNSSDGEDPYATDNDKERKKRRRKKRTFVNQGPDDDAWVCVRKNVLPSEAGCALSSQTSPTQEEAPSADPPYPNLMSVPGYSDDEEKFCSDNTEKGVSQTPLTVTSQDVATATQADAQADAEAAVEADAEADAQGGASGAATCGSLEDPSFLNLCPECDKPVCRSMLRGMNKDGLYFHDECKPENMRPSICKKCNKHQTRAQKHGTSSSGQQKCAVFPGSCDCSK